MRIYSVTEFREELNELLAQVAVAIEGEISDVHISQNRFVWFTLADEKTSISCFMLAFQLQQPIENGMKVRVVGAPTMFTKGKLVFRPRTIELIGEGSLQRAFELLKRKLDAEGLFDASRKRALSRFPQRIGLITSSDAAAYTDVLRILKNRWAGLEIVHVNVQVQGVQAAQSIVGALTQLNEDEPALECIILTRGGGSLEDLQAFNTEEVVRAIFASAIPIVCAVGHERDVTLSDLAADVRASTPSNAAEMVVPHKKDLLAEVEYQIAACEQAIRMTLTQHQRRVTEAVNILEFSARRSVTECDDLIQRLLFRFEAISSQIVLQRQRVDHLVQLLQSMNPLSVLKRGYTLTYDERGKLLKSMRDTARAQQFTTRFHDGTVRSAPIKP